jgi:DNA-binding MurR/RpiR family transcriptional regulator
VGVARLEAARRGESLLVVTPERAPAPLLERVHDARRGGATILALDRGDGELEQLAHEALAVPATSAPLSFDAAQHLVSTAAGERAARPPGIRARLGRLLDAVSGPASPGL